MELLTYSNFETIGCRASIRFPREDFSLDTTMEAFYPKCAEFFDAEPVVMPAQTNLPPEAPRVVLENTPPFWRIEIASSRMDLLWHKVENQPAISTNNFFSKAIELFSEYKKATKCNIYRLAGFLKRHSQHKVPTAKLLTLHFCQDQWNESAFNRPDNFELNLHKNYKLKKTFNVSSWVRNQSGTLTEQDQNIHIVLFEQEIDTCDQIVKKYNVYEVEQFFNMIKSECDSILRLYYPPLAYRHY